MAAISDMSQIFTDLVETGVWLPCVALARTAWKLVIKVVVIKVVGGRVSPKGQAVQTNLSV